MDIPAPAEPGLTHGRRPEREADQGVAEPGLVVVDVAAADDATAFALQEALAERWATATDDRTTRTPGEPGVRLRCYLDLRQELPAVVSPTTKPTTA
ncbi:MULTISPECIES: DUF6207 family protein [unclassified Streptomyces]|uniref:DUF6207 family protein n=1 Tax=unclassified Streptomyces TaxID=2593676 RepID=UPI003323677F